MSEELPSKSETPLFLDDSETGGYEPGWGETRLKHLLNDPALHEFKIELRRQRDQMYILYLAGLGLIALGAAVLTVCFPGDKAGIIGFVTGFGVFAVWVLIAFIVERIWK